MSLIEKAFERKNPEKAQASVTGHQFPSANRQQKTDNREDNNKPRLSIDSKFLNKRGMVTLDEYRSPIKEQFRFIKRKILRNAFGPQSATLTHPNLVMVTGSNPFEGKSFVAANLALSVAHEKDNTVLLVDADVLRPNVCNTLGIQEPVTGLTNRLLDEIDDISEGIYPTNIERLSIMPSGPQHHLSAELLRSQCMFDLAEELANRYSDRLIIFDAPPLLGINETQILANLVGQILIVVEEGKTTHKALKAALNLLDPEKAIGCVLNKSSNTKQQDYAHGYGYATR